MISRSFIELWEPRYDNQKYPEDFYRNHREGALNVKHSEQLKEHLIALLHWKDGKAGAYVRGEKHAKPNTLRPICELTIYRLATFSELFRNLVQAGKNDLERCTQSLRDLLRHMWNTVVIPAFILHVAKAEQLPIIDQHTIRAFLCLKNGKIIKEPKITWNLWRQYVAFFQTAVAHADYNHNLEDRFKVDRALFAWGKSLKSSAESNPKPRPPEPIPMINGPSFWGQQVPNTGVIPSACNVLIAVQNYLDHGNLNALPQFKKQNLRDLQFHLFPQPDLRELLQNPDRNVARQLLQYYRQEMGGEREIWRLPRPILDVFLVGWAIRCGRRRPTQITGHLYTHGFGGTRNAAQAAVTVGRTTGRLFGLLEEDGSPTALFEEYFDV